jgi:hypothetical protein
MLIALTQDTSGSVIIATGGKEIDRWIGQIQGMSRTSINATLIARQIQALCSDVTREKIDEMKKQKGRRKRRGGRNRQQNEDGSAFTSCVKERNETQSCSCRQKTDDR